MAGQNMTSGSATRTQSFTPSTPDNRVDYSRSNVRGSGFSQSRTSSTRSNQRRSNSGR